MLRRLLPIVLVLATAAAVLRLMRNDPARAVAHIGYETICLNCRHPGIATTEELNRMVKRGDAVSPPEQMRRFKCSNCGEIQVVLKACLP